MPDEPARLLKQRSRLGVTRLPLLVLAALCAFTAACQSVRPATSALAVEGDASWNQLVDAAKKEAEISLYGGVSGGMKEAVVDRFQQAYPGITVTAKLGPAPELVAQIIAERQAKKYLADVLIGPATQSVLTLKPAGALAPLEPALVLPQVRDPSLWFDKRFWWIDAAAPYTTMRFQGYVEPTISYNTKMVDPKQFQSFRDLLDPKWKGKLVAYDVRRPGQGTDIVRFIFRDPQLGPGYIEQLFRDTDVTLSSDHRQMVDWLGQGRYPLGLWISSTQLKVAMADGVPVAEVPGEQLKEGALISTGGGNVSLMDSAPHPNAAKLFVNWLLSPQGQIAWQDNVKQPSLRVDVPHTAFEVSEVPRPGVKYIDGGTEEFTRATPADQINEVINRALDSRAK